MSRNEDARTNCDDELIRAAKSGNESACRRLLDLKGKVAKLNFFSVHSRDDYGDSPIMHASIGGHVRVVELLLSKGANPNDKNQYGESPIMWASRQGHASVV